MVALLTAVSSAGAQEQEHKLVERLLKPDTALQNHAQNKKFKFANASIDKRAQVGAFYVQEKSRPKSFTAVRGFGTRGFGSRSFYETDWKASASSQPAPIGARRSYATSNATSAHAAHDAEKETDTRDFAANRPFRVEGKSQKSLSRKNPPMTIEQVRELLNKNK
jgi:hypothetical protein